MLNLFQGEQYVLERQFLALTGKFRVYDASGEQILFSEQKIFKLKEDIRVFRDESKTQEVLSIQARQVLDISAAYDIYDAVTQEKIGVWRRRGAKSLLRDEWELLDAEDRLIGVLIEDSAKLALLRRFVLGALLPQTYVLRMADQRVALFRQRFHLLRYTLDIDFGMDVQGRLDKRLGIAGAILLAAIEGKQSN